MTLLSKCSKWRLSKKGTSCRRLDCLNKGEEWNTAGLVPLFLDNLLRALGNMIILLMQRCFPKQTSLTFLTIRQIIQHGVVVDNLENLWSFSKTNDDFGQTEQTIGRAFSMNFSKVRVSQLGRSVLKKVIEKWRPILFCLPAVGNPCGEQQLRDFRTPYLTKRMSIREYSHFGDLLHRHSRKRKWFKWIVKNRRNVSTHVCSFSLLSRGVLKSRNFCSPVSRHMVGN